jgi:hypothetical protein
LLKVLRTVGEAVGRAEAAIASAVEDLPKLIGSEDVCRDSFGRFGDSDLGLVCVMVVDVKTDGDEGRSYEVTPIFGERVACLGAQSSWKWSWGLVGVRGRTSILNSERRINLQSNIPTAVIGSCNDDDEGDARSSAQDCYPERSARSPDCGGGRI